MYAKTATRQTNALRTSIEPFAYAAFCVVCAEQVECEGEMRCDVCCEYIHSACARRGQCLNCSACADCGDDAGEEALCVSHGYEPADPHALVEAICVGCYATRVARALLRDGSPQFHAHRLTIAFGMLYKAASLAERTYLGDCLRRGGLQVELLP